MISTRFHLYLKKAALEGRILPLQKAFLLRIARIVRNVMNTSDDGSHLLPGNDPVGRPRKPCELTIIIVIIFIQYS